MLLISLTPHSSLNIRIHNRLLRQLNKKMKNTLLMTNSRETQLFRRWHLVDQLRNCSRNVYFSYHLKYLDYQLSSFLWLSLLPSTGLVMNLKYNGMILQSHISSQTEILKPSKSLRIESMFNLNGSMTVLTQALFFLYLNMLLERVYHLICLHSLNILKQNINQKDRNNLRDSKESMLKRRKKKKLKSMKMKMKKRRKKLRDKD